MSKSVPGSVEFEERRRAERHVRGNLDNLSHLLNRTHREVANMLKEVQDHIPDPQLESMLEKLRAQLTETNQVVRRNV